MANAEGPAALQKGAEPSVTAWSPQTGQPVALPESCSAFRSQPCPAQGLGETRPSRGCSTEEAEPPSPRPACSGVSEHPVHPVHLLLRISELEFQLFYGFSWAPLHQFLSLV